MNRMTKAERAKLQARVKKLVEAEGLAKTAEKIPITGATLRRFLGGQPMHEGSLQMIARALA
jgi:hypothetical protein